MDIVNPVLNFSPICVQKTKISCAGKSKTNSEPLDFFEKKHRTKQNS